MLGKKSWRQFPSVSEPLSLRKIKRKSLEQIWSYEEASFWAQNDPFTPSKIAHLPRTRFL